MTKLFLLSLATAAVNTLNLRFGVLLLGEPLVCGSLVGLFLHNFPLGLYIGAILQFMWMRSMPVGVKVQTNYTVMTVFTVYLIDLFGPVDGLKIFPLAFIVGFLMALAGKHLEILMKKLDNVIVDNVIANIRTAKLDIIHVGYLAGYTLLFAVMIFLGLHIAREYLMLAAFIFVPVGLRDAFQFAYPYLGLYALSLSFHSVEIKYKLVYLLAGAVMGILLVFFGLKVPAAILILTVVTAGIAWFIGRRTHAASAGQMGGLL